MFLEDLIKDDYSSTEFAMEVCSEYNIPFEDVAAEGFKETAKNVWKFVWGKLCELWEKIVKFFKLIGGAIAKGFKNLINLIRGGKKVTAPKETVEAVVKNANKIDSVCAEAKSVAQAASSTINNQNATPQMVEKQIRDAQEVKQTLDAVSAAVMKEPNKDGERVELREKDVQVLSKAATALAKAGEVTSDAGAKDAKKKYQEASTYKPESNEESEVEKRKSELNKELAMIDQRIVNLTKLIESLPSRAEKSEAVKKMVNYDSQMGLMIKKILTDSGKIDDLSKLLSNAENYSAQTRLTPDQIRFSTQIFMKTGSIPDSELEPLIRKILGSSVMSQIERVVKRGNDLEQDAEAKMAKFKADAKPLDDERKLARARGDSIMRELSKLK